MLTSEPDQNPLDALAPQAKGGAESVKLLVALFLILITFFVVMNSISNQKISRAGRAVESVNTAFKGDDKPFLPKVDSVDLLAGKQRDVHHDLFYEQGAGVLQALIDFPGEFAAPGGNVMQAELAASVLFGDGDVNLRADQTKFLNALADLLKKEGEGEERVVEIMLAARPPLFRAGKPQANGAIARAAAFARELEDRGVPGRSITTGIIADKRPLVWLTFISRSHGVMERDRKGAPAA